MNDEKLIPVFIPALGVLLVSMEDKKGSPLTPDEVLAIRNKAAVIMMRASDAHKMDESRGYRDIDPENCWHDWQKLRDALGRKPSLPVGARFNFAPKNDPDMQKTVEDARKSLQVFRQLLAIDATHMVKTRLVDGDNSAFMWLNDVHETNGKFAAVLFEVPSNFKKYKKGDVLTVLPSEILDWAANEDGCMHGGYSIRLMRSRKSPTEHAEFDAFMGVRSYAPLPE